MKNLILIRHAKSSWEAPVHDKERLLATRGVQDAHLVSQKISELKVQLDAWKGKETEIQTKIDAKKKELLSRL